MTHYTKPTREETALALNDLGEDPTTARVDVVWARTSSLNPAFADRHAAVRQAVDVARKLATSRFREPGIDSPHHAAWKHICAGGRVWRDDALSNVQTWIDLPSLGGDPNEIQRLGYNGLFVLPEVIERGRRFAESEVEHVGIAVDNTHAFLAAAAADRTLNVGERDSVRVVSNGLTDIQIALSGGAIPATELVYARLHRGHRLIGDRLANPSTPEGREGIASLRDLRAAMEMLTHGLSPDEGNHLIVARRSLFERQISTKERPSFRESVEGLLTWSQSIDPRSGMGAGSAIAGQGRLNAVRLQVAGALTRDPLTEAARALVDWHDRNHPHFRLDGESAALGARLRDALRAELRLKTDPQNAASATNWNRSSFGKVDGVADRPELGGRDQALGVPEDGSPCL
jgi:hypothetical protein